MIRLLFTVLVISAMALHSAARLGTLAYVYDNRHEIAFALGFVSEIPITTCDQHYDFGHGSVLTDLGQLNEGNTTIFPEAHEIILHSGENPVAIPAADRCLLAPGVTFCHVPTHLENFVLDIFHPPAV